ncbi:hypothetical protein SDC9_175251 [bioreactor metagenome]|uniref:Uncharacterized protein n=1 Tax=bioreactor metagenome TaxID=1076179 RepID=A0A645GLQ5_9ZZZZ
MVVAAGVRADAAGGAPVDHRGADHRPGVRLAVILIDPTRHRQVFCQQVGPPAFVDPVGPRRPEVQRRQEGQVVVGVHGVGGRHLPEVADAVGLAAPLPRGTQRRAQHGGQNGDDGDYDEEFNQRETDPVHCHFPMLIKDYFRYSE